MNKPNTTSHYGRYMYFVMWILLLVLLSAYFYHWDQSTSNPNQSPQARLVGADRYEIVLQRNRHGHYVVNGEINGVNVIFFIDTGASDISIPGHIADKIGLKPGYKRTYQTANGKWQHRKFHNKSGYSEHWPNRTQKCSRLDKPKCTI